MYVHLDEFVLCSHRFKGVVITTSVRMSLVVVPVITDDDDHAHDDVDYNDNGYSFSTS